MCIHSPCYHLVMCWTLSQCLEGRFYARYRPSSCMEGAQKVEVSSRPGPEATDAAEHDQRSLAQLSKIYSKPFLSTAVDV
jgi:hypothetical protein